MDYNNLNDREVQSLIKELKHPKHRNSIEESYNIINTLFGQIDHDISIINVRDLQYILHIYRGKLDSERYSIHIRFKQFHHTLVRVDINPNQKHYNPDGTLIEGSHIHIYNDNQTKKDRVAIPLAESDFPNITNLIDAFEKFLTYNNIR